MALQVNFEIGGVSFPEAYVTIRNVRGDNDKNWTARAYIYGDKRKIRVWDDSIQVAADYEKDANPYAQLYNALKTEYFPDAIDLN